MESVLIVTASPAQVFASTPASLGTLTAAVHLRGDNDWLFYFRRLW